MRSRLAIVCCLITAKCTYRQTLKAGHVCGDDRDLVDGRPTGSVRVSFGYMSTQRDADRLLNMIRSCFVEGVTASKALGLQALCMPLLTEEYKEVGDIRLAQCENNSDDQDGSEETTKHKYEVSFVASRPENEFVPEDSAIRDIGLHPPLKLEIGHHHRKLHLEVNSRKNGLIACLRQEDFLKVDSEGVDKKQVLSRTSIVSGFTHQTACPAYLAHADGRKTRSAERPEPQIPSGDSVDPARSLGNASRQGADPVRSGRVDKAGRTGEASVALAVTAFESLNPEKRQQDDCHASNTDIPFSQPEAQTPDSIDSSLLKRLVDLQTGDEASTSLQEDTVRGTTQEIVEANRARGSRTETLSDDDVHRPASAAVCNCSMFSSDGCRGNHLTNIVLYPVKSCGALQVTSWPIGERGLLFDREWMIVNSMGVSLTQKRERRLCLIRPIIDLDERLLMLECEGCPLLSLPLDMDSKDVQYSGLCNSKVCHDRVATVDCGDPAAEWLDHALAPLRGCRLQRLHPDSRRPPAASRDDASGTHQEALLGLANESQFLLLSRRSVSALVGDIRSRGAETSGGTNEEQLLGRFRGNLVVGGVSPYQEDEWRSVQIGHHLFQVQGRCSRCQMVCIDQSTAERTREPLLTLAATRGRKIPFGIHLVHLSRGESCEDESRMIAVGDPVVSEIQEPANDEE